MGRKLVLTGTKLTDLAAPKLATVDPMESAGLLMLIEPQHPSQQWAAGVPASGGTVPNLAAPFAKTLLNTTSSVDLDFTSSGMSGTQGKLERTGKGGLHAIYSNTDATNIGTSASCYASIRPPMNIRDYLATNYGHEIYVSVWSRVTRLAPTGQQANQFFQIGSGVSTTSNYKLLISQAGSAATGGGTGYRSADSRTPGGVVGPQLQNVARATYSGTAVTAGNSMEAYMWTVGNFGVVNSYLTAKQGVSSRVLYRVFVEDLTVSGRTYAQVDALDLAEYNKHVLTAGGRYYGDTFTDPATIA